MSTKKKIRKEKKNLELNRVLTVGEVDVDTANEVLEAIYIVNLEDEGINVEKREPLTIVVNSPGGEVYDGIAIVDAMNLSKTPINVVVLGRAMSMGLLIAACGHHRAASRNARFMYHEGSYEASGTGKIHKNELAEYTKLEKLYDNILMEKTKLTTKELKNIKNSAKEWYFDSNTALKLGIIDEIVE
jgi:ATP-dependent Clp protease protease subunit